MSGTINEILYCDRCGKQIPINKFDYNEDRSKYNIALEGGMAGTLQRDISFDGNDIFYLCKKCWGEVANDIISFRREYNTMKMYRIKKIENRIDEYYFDRFNINQPTSSSIIPKWTKKINESLLYRTKESAEEDKKEIERNSIFAIDTITDISVVEYEIPEYELGPIDEGDYGQAYYDYPMWGIKATNRKTDKVRYYDPMSERWFDSVNMINYPLKQSEYPYIINRISNDIDMLPIEERIVIEPFLFTKYFKH